jgi:hypothetical protein
MFGMPNEGSKPVEPVPLSCTAAIAGRAHQKFGVPIFDKQKRQMQFPARPGP